MAEWTEGRKKAFIVSVLRSGTRRYPPKYQTLNEACVGIRHNEKTKRDGKHYLCAACHGEYPTKEVQVNHKIPVVDPKTGFTTWDEYISRLYCNKENLEVLCIPCHKKITLEENASRTRSKKKRG